MQKIREMDAADDLKAALEAAEAQIEGRQQWDCTRP